MSRFYDSNESKFLSDIKTKDFFEKHCSPSWHNTIMLLDLNNKILIEPRPISLDGDIEINMMPMGYPYESLYYKGRAKAFDAAIRHVKIEDRTCFIKLHSIAEKKDLAVEIAAIKYSSVIIYSLSAAYMAPSLFSFLLGVMVGKAPINFAASSVKKNDLSAFVDSSQQHASNAVISNDKFTYIVEVPATCADKMEVSIEKSDHRQWIICPLENAPSLYSYERIEASIATGATIVVSLFTAFYAKNIISWIIAPYAPYVTVTYGVVGFALGTGFFLVSSIKDNNYVMNQEQLLANEIVSKDPEHLYLAQYPGSCRAGDTIIQDYPNKWIVCQLIDAPISDSEAMGQDTTACHQDL